MFSTETSGYCCGNKALKEEGKMLRFDIQQQFILKQQKLQ